MASGFTFTNALSGVRGITAEGNIKHTSAVHSYLQSSIDSSSFFQTEPEKYEDFVLSALKAPEIQRLYDKKALAAVLRQFLLHSEYNGYEINRLKETFYSKEELEDERRVEAERKKQEKRLDRNGKSCSNFITAAPNLWLNSLGDIITGMRRKRYWI